MTYKEIFCPHCGRILNEDECYDLSICDKAHDEEPLDIQCSGCEKVFYVKCGWIPEFECFETEDERDL